LSATPRKYRGASKTCKLTRRRFRRRSLFLLNLVKGKENVPDQLMPNPKKRTRGRFGFS